MFYLTVFFGILTILFGFLGFGPWEPPSWAASQVMFWFCLVVFVLLVVVQAVTRGRYSRQSLPHA
jgi:uncharacterized membrane protein YtjA (UPF0391 family)